MTKRLCPFDDFTPQMKYKVGEEDVASTKEIFKKEVYRKSILMKQFKINGLLILSPFI